MSGQRRNLILRALGLLLWLAAAAPAQLAWLDVAPESAQVPGLGDTIAVDVFVDAQGRSMTSVGLSVTYHPGDLEVLDTVPTPAAEPFRVAPELAADIYKNDLIQLASDEARARLVLVTAQMSSQRQVIAGRQAVARIRWRVLRASSGTRIGLVLAGPDGPVFTELGQPGRQQSFHLQRPEVSLVLQADGFVPIEDLVLDARQPWERSLARIHPSDQLSWIIEHDADHLLAAETVDGVLRLHARPRVSGEARISYRALIDGQVLLQGDFRVQVVAGEPLLELGPLTLVEDGDPVTLAGVVSGEAPPGSRLLVSGDRGVLVRSSEEGWRVAGEPDWSGPSRLTLRLLNAAADLIDSLQVPVTIVAVDDPPQLRDQDTLATVTGLRSWGPSLTDLLVDVDDDVTSLRVQVEGDRFVAADLEAGRLRLLGLQAGLGTIHLAVTDEKGLHWQWSLHVRVASPTHGPRFLPWVPARLPVGQVQTWQWQDLVRDDGPLSDLQGQVEASEHLQISPTESGFTLQAMVTGAGWIRLLIMDPEGNTASTVLPVEVIDATSTDEGAVEVEPPTADPMTGHSTDTGAQSGGPADVDIDPGAVDVSEELTGEGSPGQGTAAEGDPGLLDRVHLDLPSQLELVAGTGLDINLADRLEGVDADQVLWAVSDGEWVHALVDAHGHLRLQASTATTGTDQISIHIWIDQQRLTVPLLVQLEAAPARLHILEIPSIHLSQGKSVELDLTAFAADASGPVLWQVDPAQLVSAHIEAGVLHLRAESGHIGEEAVQLTASDEAVTAFRLIRVVVDADTLQPVQITPPTSLTANPGDLIGLDPSIWVTEGQVIAWEVISTSAPGVLTVEDGQIRLSIAASAAAGRHEFLLEAVTPDTRIRLTLPVTVVRRPELTLNPVPVLRIGAGEKRAILALDGLVKAADGQVRWQLLETGRLGVSLEGDSLMVDARQALPGRQVVRLRASTAARQADLVLSIRIDAPQILTSSWHVELTPGIAARLSLDQQDSADPGFLEWSVVHVDSGITATVNEQTRQLSVAADLPGQILLQAYLSNGLQVATQQIHIDLMMKPGGDDSQADDVARETDPVEAPTMPSWHLRAPVIEPAWAGEPRTIELAAMIVDFAETDLSGFKWETTLLGGQGNARVEGDHLTIVAHSSATLWIRAMDGEGNEQSLVAPVVVRAPSLPELGIRVQDDGVRFQVHVEAPAVAALQVNHAALSLSGGAAHLALAPGQHDLMVEAIAVVHTTQMVVRQRIKVVVSSLDGGGVVAEDGSARIEIPQGVAGAALLQSEGDGYRVFLSSKLERSGVGLFIADPSEQAMKTPDSLFGDPFAGSSVTGGSHRPAAVWVLERMTTDGWIGVPSFRIDTPRPGLYAMVGDSGVYRRVAVDDGGAGLRQLSAYPNPFNAQITVQYVVPEDGFSLTIEIYNSLGQPIRTWQLRRPAGVGALVWDGLDGAGQPAASGVYLVRVRTPLEAVTHKLLLVR